MYDHLIEIVKKDKLTWAEIQKMFIEQSIPAKTVLLDDGKISTKLFFIKRDACAYGLINRARTLLFNSSLKIKPFSSIDSFINNKPSRSRYLIKH